MPQDSSAGQHCDDASFSDGHCRVHAEALEGFARSNVALLPPDSFNVTSWFSGEQSNVDLAAEERDIERFSKRSNEDLVVFGIAPAQFVIHVQARKWSDQPARMEVGHDVGKRR